MSLRRNLALASSLLLVMVFLAAAGYRLLGGPKVTLLDAIYMAVITIATVGYGEVIDTSTNPSLRVFNIFVILFGIGIMLYVFSASTAFIVEGELKDIFRRRKMLKQIQQLKDHFIVCGAGETGQFVIEELIKSGHSFVVIDLDEGHLEKVQHLGQFPVLKGDADDDEVLDAAGLERARGLVTALPDDRDNLMVTVTVRQKNPTIRIVARCAEAGMVDKLIRAGANSAVSPNMIGGLRLASELIRPGVVGFLDQMLRNQSRTLRVEEIAVPQVSPWVGKTIHDIGIHRRFDLLALALRRSTGDMVYNPQGDAVLASADVLVVMGDVEKVWKAREAAGLPASPTLG